MTDFFMKHVLYFLCSLLICIVTVSGCDLFLSETESGQENTEGRDISSLGEDDDAAPSRVELLQGRMVVRLPENLQRQAGIETVLLEQTFRPSGLYAFAEVIDIQPLLKFRSGYNFIRSARKIAESEFLASSQEYERLRLLHGEASNISARQLQQAHARWLADSTRVQAHKQKLEDIRAESVQRWGHQIINAVINETDMFKKLRSGEAVLVLLTLTRNQHLAAETDTIYISRSGSNAHKQEAYYLSPASHTNRLLQGETYYFYTQAGELRTGMYLDAWIPSGQASAQGVSVPDSAIIWYVDKPWVYIKLDSRTFMRQPLQHYIEGNDDWFVKEGVKQGDQIVIKGGQMLLSEEFRWSIPDEDDNP